MLDINKKLFDKIHIGSAVWRFPNEGISVSVCELGDRVKAYAKVLKNNNIGKGDTIGFIVDNSYDLVCLLYATWYLNAIAVPLRPRSGRYHDYRTYVSNCDETCHFKLIIFEGESIADELSSWASGRDKSVLSIQEIVSAADADHTVDSLEPAVISPQNIAIIQFSSGSTGDPKGVVVTHSMMMTQLQNIEDNHGRSRAGHKVASSASWLPINHDMGMFIGVLSPIFSGCDNLLTTPSYYMKNPPRWFGLLSEHSVDITFSTNSVLASSLNTLRRLRKQSNVDLSNLHIYIAAEKVSPIIVRRTWDSLSAFGCPKENIHVGYGMAENTLGATYTTSGPIKMHWFVLNRNDSLSLSDDTNPHAFELASIGIPNDDHTITVRDRMDTILPELKLGELSIESPCVSPAYYNDPKTTALRLKDGRLRTGDLAFKYDGEFYFYSRTDDLIIVGGRNLVPDDVETTIESLDFIRPGSSVLLAIEDKHTGVTQLHLLVERNARWSEEDIQTQCIKLRKHIFNVHDLLVKNISVCTKGSIEKTSSGKKRRKVIRRRLLNSEIAFLPQDAPKQTKKRAFDMDIKQQYKDYCKPKLAELLSALKLDTHAVSAEGNYIKSDDGKNILDMVSGFGAAVLGHNHPEIIETATAALQNKMPINVQGTVRGPSARLAKRLNELLPPDSASYCVNFSNSGTESIEVAIKHAYKVRFEKVLREYERLSRLLNDFHYRVERMPERPELPGKNNDLIDFRDDLNEYNLAQFESFQNNPVMISFKGGYHGKTISSLKVTFNKSFRESFEGLSAIKPVFIDSKSPERIAEVVDENMCTFYYPTIENNKVELKPVKLTKVIGLIFEIIMGEGGIKPLSDETLSYLAAQHKTIGLPYIIDEIQTGCGRIGNIYSYSDTPLANISPEYIALSKALGGAVAKIGATLIREDIYEHDFGILHTSTFGEDDFSSEIALSTLNILTRNNNEVLANVRTKGQLLLDQLNNLRREYPEIIKEVRGKGLMLGLEFTALEEQSPFFRASGKQGILSLLVASYLLEYHHLRVLAPLTTMLKGNPGKNRLSVIRIQPPLTVTEWEVQRLVVGLREVCEIIQNNNEFCLIGHLIGSPVDNKQRKTCRYFEARWPVIEDSQAIDARAGFIVHPINLKALIEYYFPSFEAYVCEEEKVFSWWNSISRFLEPVHVKNEYVTSNEFTVELNLVFVPYLPYFINAHKDDVRLAREMRDKVQDAVTVARELGDDNIPVSMVGLGAYTSIITQNAQTINDYEIPVTTGNAYTVGLTVQGILSAAGDKGLNINHAKVAVVGAAGNIGLVLGQILLPRVRNLVLVGSRKPGSEYRLRYARQQCLYELLNVIKDEHQRAIDIKDTLIQGQGYQIYRYLQDGTSEATTSLKAALATGEITLAHAKLLDKVLSEEAVDLNLPITTSATNLQDCDIIVVTTNSEEADLIRPEQLKPGAIVCCASVPSNLSHLFSNEGDKLAFDGGLAKLPEDSEINFVGMPQDGLAYGCLAETLVLAFDGQNHSYSKGMLLPSQVYGILEKALLHGFGLGGLKFDDQALSSGGKPEYARTT